MPSHLFRLQGSAHFRLCDSFSTSNRGQMLKIAL